MRHNDALKVATAAISRDGQNTELMTLLGEAYLALGHPVQAVKCLQQSFLANQYDDRTGKLFSRTLRLLGIHDQNLCLLESGELLPYVYRVSVILLRGFCWK